MHFKIIIPMYNVENWIETTIKSIKEQSYTDFQCILLDDLSTDDTVNKCRVAIENDTRFKLVINSKKMYALGNHITGINLAEPKDEDIIIHVDGDDWLANKNVLQKVKNAYEEKNCLMTYGNHVDYPAGEPRNPLFRYPKEVVDFNKFRNYRFLVSHLRTFKYKLWKQIDQQDFLDKNGNLYKRTCDLAMMFPLIELAGDRFEFIEDVLYVYNMSNPLNDFKVDHKEQFSYELELRNKKKYERCNL